jgi:hypothetical protein
MRRTLQTFLVAIYLVAAATVGAAQPDLTLARVNKIFVHSWPTSPRESQVASVTRELKRVGFTVVDDPSQADAILTCEEQREIVLHGDSNDPDKSIFNYSLSVPDGKPVWKHTVKFVSKSSPADDTDYAATKVAERLLKDHEKSRRKAIGS